MRIKILSTLISAALCCTLSVGCQNRQALSHQLNSDATLKTESAIAEAVFAFQIKENPLNGAYHHYFLAIGDDQDPGNELMARMKKLRYSIKPFSDASYSNDGRVIDKQTGELGIIIKVNKVTLKGKNEAQVSGSVKTSGENLHGYVYSVFLEGDRWTVKDYKGTFVS